MESNAQMASFQQQQQQHWQQPFNGGAGNPWLNGNMGMNRENVQQFYEQGEQRYNRGCEPSHNAQKKKQNGWIKIKAIFKKQKKGKRKSKKVRESGDADECSSNDDFVATAYIPVYSTNEGGGNPECVHSSLQSERVCEAPIPSLPPMSSQFVPGAGLYPQLPQSIPTAPSLAPPPLPQQERAMYNGDTVPRRFACVPEATQPVSPGASMAHLAEAFSRPSQGAHVERPCASAQPAPAEGMRAQPVATAVRDDKDAICNLDDNTTPEEYSITDSK